MTTLIRVISSAPSFREAGLNITDKWSTVDLDSLSPEARDTLELQAGRIVQVHEEDVEKFASSTNGLEFHEGMLRYPGGKQPDDQIAIGQRHRHNAVNAEIAAQQKAAQAARASSTPAATETAQAEAETPSDRPTRRSR